MKFSPLLSICIPTFQRKNALERTLKKLVESEKLVPGKIEVCISDNASNDGTFEMIKEYKKRSPFIKIKKNAKNIGFDSNLITSFKMAHGRYCWGIGDDDTIIPLGIKNLIVLLSRKEQFVMGFSGGIAYKRDIEMINRSFPKEKCNNKEFINGLISIIEKSSKIIKSSQDITILGFLPCYFFDTKLLKNSFKKVKNKKCGWHHLAILFYIVSNFRGDILINKKVSLNHGQIEERKRDSMLLPGDDFELLINRRIRTLSDICIDEKLRKTFYNWLNIRGNYFYIKNLVELMLFYERFNNLEYSALKKKVYACKKNLSMPFFIRLGTTFFVSMEPLTIFKKSVSFLYSKIHPSYVKLLDDYIEGGLQTQDERNKITPK